MKTIEFKESIKTPDAGSVVTVMISPDSLVLPFFDKSVAGEMKELPYGVSLTYRTGQVVTVPYSNIRYITVDAEVNDKKQVPHSFDPFKKNKNK